MGRLPVLVVGLLVEGGEDGFGRVADGVEDGFGGVADGVELFGGEAVDEQSANRRQVRPPPSPADHEPAVSSEV